MKWRRTFENQRKLYHEIRKEAKDIQESRSFACSADFIQHGNMTVVPPMCREAWIVTAADKYCSLLETLHIHKRHVRKRGNQ